MKCYQIKLNFFFKVNSLPSIKSNASPTDILAWKRKSEIATCYRKLFKPMDNDDNSALSCILQKVPRTAMHLTYR